MYLNSKKKEIQKLKKHSKIFKKKAKDKFENYNSTINNPFTKNYETNKSHDKLIDICISAFTRGNACYEKLNYCFISTDPLIELDIKNFDVLILNHISKYAIFVECKTSIRKGEVNKKYEAIKNVIDKKNYLEEKIGNKIEHMEFVFCVPPSKIKDLIVQLENVEINKKIDCEKDHIFLIWQVDGFQKKQILQLFESKKIKTRKNDSYYHHKDKEITKMLRKGILVDNEFVGDIHPSSHPCKQGRALIAKIICENERVISTKELDSEEAAKIKKSFSKDVVYDYFQDDKTLTHYDRKTIGQILADRFIREGQKYEIIEPLENNKYNLNVSGEGLHTILNNYEKKYKEEFLKEYAEKESYEEHISKHKKLF
jgi:hypothetical protein